MAHMCCVFPVVERRGPKVIAVKADNYMGAYKQLLGCLIISKTAASGWTGIWMTSATPLCKDAFYHRRVPSGRMPTLSASGIILIAGKNT